MVGKVRPISLPLPYFLVSWLMRGDVDGIAIGNVLRNWPHIFGVLNLFSELGFGEMWERF